MRLVSAATAAPRALDGSNQVARVTSSPPAAIRNRPGSAGGGRSARSAHGKKQQPLPRFDCEQAAVPWRVREP